MPPLRPALAAALLAALALPTLAGDRTPLTAPELTELLSGNTETWSTLGAGYYDPSGSIAFIWKKKPGSGEWKITADQESGDGKLCLKITEWYGQDFNCSWTYFREDGDIYSLNLKTDKATKMPGFTPGKTF
ncbi:MAG: DUF995 domain-containing protein [Paracoccaceae bacterium]|nr:DUF995 domain-containing protein [Paracoccaceae bacterium]